MIRSPPNKTLTVTNSANFSRSDVNIHTITSPKNASHNMNPPSFEQLRETVATLQAELSFLKTENANLRRKIGENTLFENKTPHEETGFLTDEDELAKETDWTVKVNTKKNRRGKKRPAVSPASEQETTPDVNRIAERRTSNNTGSASRNAPKPPQITVQKGVKFLELQKILLKVTDDPEMIITRTLNSQEIKVLAQNDDIYRKVILALKEANIQYHHYQLKADKPFQVVFRGLHPDTDVKEIKEELERKGHKTRAVTNITSKRKIDEKITKVKLPLFYVDIEPAANNRDVMNLRTVAHQSITVEPPRQNKITPQCLRCLQFGHTKNYCTRQVVCFKCAETHHPEKCTKPREAQPKCGNCSGEHIAIYKGCPAYQVILASSKPKPHQARDSQTAVQRITRPTSTTGNTTSRSNNPTSATVSNHTSSTSYRNVIIKPPASSTLCTTTPATDRLDEILSCIKTILHRLDKLESLVGLQNDG